MPMPLIALLIVLTLAGGAWGLVHMANNGPKARLKRRIAAVTGGGAGRKLAKGMMASVVQNQKKKAIQAKLKGIEETRSNSKKGQLRARLVQTGTAMTVRQFMIGSVVGGLLFLGIGLLVKLPMPHLTVPALALIGGLGLPRFVVSYLIKKRQKSFTKDFPDALDVITRGIRSGLPVGECFAMIAREMPDPIGIEFRLITEGQKLGLTLDEVLERSCERVATPEMRFFAIVLSIQQQTGGNLAETLAKLSDVLRQRKRMRDKVQAMSSEAKSSAGIIGSLPILVGGILALIAPDYVGLLITTDTGNMLLASGACIMGVGVFVMRQMINFDM